MVTINVGPKKQSFVVHKTFICHYSLFFNAAFKEGESQSLDLEDADPAMFSIFVQWIYSQGIDQKPKPPSVTLLIKLWVFAELALVPKLQNQALNLISGYSLDPSKYTIDDLCYIYDNTAKGSSLCRFFASNYASYKGAQMTTINSPEPSFLTCSAI
jgi:BTB/POZ domain